MGGYLARWAEQLEHGGDPASMQEALQAHLKRFPFHALGWWYLARLYLRLGDQANARLALARARLAHPYSPLLRDYVTAPSASGAEISKVDPQPHTRVPPSSGPSHTAAERESLDLDAIICQLQEAEPRRSFAEGEEQHSPEDLAVPSDTPRVPYTETLAAIYWEKGDWEGALRAYSWLAEHNPSRAAYYEERIREIRERISEAERGA
jgi:tetratricopeptide (TPR) repeat protein|nr:MAG: hypothetical protein KatS3mg041_1020 [Bacteroidota bacterium]